MKRKKLRQKRNEFSPGSTFVFWMQLIGWKRTQQKKKKKKLQVVWLKKSPVTNPRMWWAWKHWWFSGRILACHAGGPGSIPGQCIQHFLHDSFLSQHKTEKNNPFFCFIKQDCMFTAKPQTFVWCSLFHFCIPNKNYPKTTTKTNNNYINYKVEQQKIPPKRKFRICLHHQDTLTDTVKSHIFVRYFISYFRTVEKSAKFNTGWKFIFVLRPSNFNVILFEALESTKISSYEPVSSQKYENGYRTKMCNFTVEQKKIPPKRKFRICLHHQDTWTDRWTSKPKRYTRKKGKWQIESSHGRVLGQIHVHDECESIGGSVVEFSPATREARVQFPANAFNTFFFCFHKENHRSDKLLSSQKFVFNTIFSPFVVFFFFFFFFFSEETTQQLHQTFPFFPDKDVKWQLDLTKKAQRSPAGDRTWVFWLLVGRSHLCR